VAQALARRPRLRAVWAVRVGSIKAVPLKHLPLPLSRKAVAWGLDILAQEVAIRKRVIKARSIRVGNPKGNQLELFDPFTDLGDIVMGKVLSSGDKPGFFAKGGTGKMFGKGGAGDAASGVSGKESNAPSGSSDKFASGGKTKMFGKQTANKMTPGQSGKSG